jgi:hypothetical protein
MRPLELVTALRFDVDTRFHALLGSAPLPLRLLFAFPFVFLRLHAQGRHERGVEDLRRLELRASAGVFLELREEADPVRGGKGIDGVL